MNTNDRAYSVAFTKYTFAVSYYVLAMLLCCFFSTELATMIPQLISIYEFTVYLKAEKKAINIVGANKWALISLALTMCILPHPGPAEVKKDFDSNFIESSN